MKIITLKKREIRLITFTYYYSYFAYFFKRNL